jgi:hypothetical protein
MIRVCLLLTWAWFGVASPIAIAEPLLGADLSADDFVPPGPSEEVTPPTQPPPASMLPLIAGRPYEEAQAILGRHEQELIHLPGANGVSMDSEGLIVYTDNPTVVPPQVEGLPVRAMPPLKRGPISSGQKAGEESLSEASEEAGTPTEGQCGTEAYWDATLGHCQRHAQPPTLDPNLLPPPPGVIILRPDGKREQADACPIGFNEHVSLNSWRFCLSPGHSGPIPPLMAPPIAGIAYEEALKILERHQESLMKLPGVESVGLDAEGIRVETKTPPPGLPAAVEGLPVRVVPPSDGPLIGANHTSTTRVRPLHGGVAMADDFVPALGGTLTAVGLFQGKPWLIFPSHLLRTCYVGGPPDQLCPVGTPLASCSNHYGGTTQVRQPIGTVPEIVGFAQRWDVLQAGVNTTDAALAFMDNDTIEGNGSLSANRTLEIWGTFSGREAIPVVSSTATVTVVSMDPTNSGTHLKPARVSAVGQARNVGFGCRGQGSPLVPLISQTDLQAIGNVCFSPGDSGSPVLNSAGEIIGMFNWIDTGSATCTGGGNVRGGGTSASVVRQVLGFDSWYGTQTSGATTITADNSIGLFRPSNAIWSQDNGNGKFDGCGAEQSGGNPNTQDYCYGVFGAPGKNDIAVPGDWDGNGSITLGVYHTDQTACPNTSSQCFRLSNSNFPPATSSVIHTGPASFGYRPVVGKWPGPPPVNNGKTKVGVFRSSTGEWYLESGNGLVDGCSNDYCFDTYDGNPNNTSPSNWTRPGDIPLAGDWNGDGTVTVGVFRPSNGTFYLSNTYLTIGAQPVLSVSSFAVDPTLGYAPVVGNWTGTAGDKLGLFKSSISRWYLDNGNLSWPSCTEDQCSTLYTGAAGDHPAVFGSSTVKSN